ncbi:MAG: lipoyl(octanoyl) transferase LipB [Nevskiaceae bacterium]|nr:MAG: lipoyl(octanoyl) transferase LipB [Nevskiaceae bacterium]TBR74475.1 MAG: lipoyl(octanoyl) transferase LipB [Nevskiaceae bacterium]
MRELGVCDYGETFVRMRAFTDARGPDTPDELWLLEHPPVFTQGQAGKPENVLCPGDIPVVQSDRGGQVTYHGPGQCVLYVLVDLRRLGIGIRSLVHAIERAMIDVCATHGVVAFARPKAPGVYVDAAFGGPAREVRKIGSLGLRVRRGCTYHGLAFNVAMDLAPFDRINPCGYADLHMAQLADLVARSAPVPDTRDVGRQLAAAVQRELGVASAARNRCRLS